MNLEDLVIQEWEEKFDEKFVRADGEGNQYIGSSASVGDIKQFIREIKTVKPVKASSLIDAWIDWNDKKIHSHDFCFKFRDVYWDTIKKRL